MKRKQIPLALVFAIVVLIAAVAGYMLLIRPKAAEVEKLDEEIAALETQRQAASLSQGDEEQPQTTIKVADLVELAKAMPEQVDMAGAILELNAAAKRAGVEFTSIQPGAAAPGLGYVQLPLALTYVGNYYDLTELLYQLRQLVTVREGVLDANGRLFTLDSLDWHEAEEPGFPIIEANLVVSAYVYGNDAALLAPLSEGASATTAPTETTGGTTTPPEDGSAPSQGSTSPEGGAPTTTTPTTTTPPATVDAGAQAAGATP